MYGVLLCLKTWTCVLCLATTLTVVGGGGRGMRPYSYQYFRQEFVPRARTPPPPPPPSPDDDFRYSEEFDDDDTGIDCDNRKFGDFVDCYCVE